MSLTESQFDGIQPKGSEDDLHKLVEQELDAALGRLPEVAEDTTSGGGVRENAGEESMPRDELLFWIESRIHAICLGMALSLQKEGIFKASSIDPIEWLSQRHEEIAFNLFDPKEGDYPLLPSLVPNSLVMEILDRTRLYATTEIEAQARVLYTNRSKLGAKKAV